MLLKKKTRNIIVNRVSLYLKFVLNEYSNKEILLLNKFYKIAWGVADKASPHKGMNLFILVRTDLIYKGEVKRTTPKRFENLLQEVRKSSLYQDDYVYSLENNYHMIIVKIPEKYKDSYKEFLKGNFSKMYSKGQIKSFQIKSDKIKGVLVNPDEDVLRANLAVHFNVSKDTVNGLHLINDKEADLPPSFFFYNEIFDV